LSRDIAINQILINSNTSWGLTITQIMAYSPMDMAMSIIIAKVGFGNKMVIALIIAFLL